MFPRRILTRATLAALMAATAAMGMTPAGERELASALGDRTPGEPVNCVSPLNQTSVQVIAGTAIVYGFGTRRYVNRPVDGAETLRRDDVLVLQVVRERMCRLDTVTLLALTSRLPRGVVRLGSFVPYTHPRQR